MSASREKKKRLNQPEVTATEAAPKKSMNKCMKRALTVIVAIVVVAAIVFLGMVSSGFFQKHLTAAVINGHKVTPAMMSYFYVNAYTNLQSTMQFDTETPLSEQEAYGENLGEYVDEYTLTSATNIYAMYDEAVANGFELDEEAQAAIDSELQMMDLYAQMYGFSSGSAMLVSQYGPGADEDSYIEYLTISQTAQQYSTKMQEEKEYTDEDLTAHYEENSDTFNAASFRQFSVTPSFLGVEADEAGLKACEEVANEVAAAAEAGEEAFLDAVMAAVPEDYEGEYDAETTTLRENVSFANFSEVYKEWLSDDARQEGDVTCVENGESGYIVLYYLHREDHSFQLPNVRHILISFGDAADEAAKEEAKAEADHVLEEYMAGEQTEEAFAELAKTHSSDNAEEGGLYENITPGSMVETFDAWCFDEARQIGDTGIVETEYGYHVMYFCGYGDTYLNYIVENDLRYTDFQAWYDEVTADVTCTANDFGMRYVINM